MFAKQTQQLIEDAVNSEWLNACNTYGNTYHSLHEAYAVLKEEMEEVSGYFESAKLELEDLWQDTKLDAETDAKSDARSIAFDAVQLALEAVQVAAVCKKILEG